jgi:hypothetical protein
MGAVLGSLLPGFREVRAPLIGGYLWLCALWLAIGPSLPPREEASGVVADVLELADRVPAVAVFAVLSMVAYLLGSAVEDVLRGIREQWRTRRAYAFTEWGERPRHNASLQAVVSLEMLASERVREAQGKLAAGGDDLSALPDALIRPEAQHQFQPQRPRQYWTDEEEDRATQLTDALRQKTLRELGLVRFRLMGDEPELYGEIDRARAEAELRVAIALPLVVIGAVLGIRTSPWWAGLGIGVGLGVLAGLLLWQAREREQKANDRLVDAVFINKVQAPVLDQLGRATEEILQQDLDQRRANRTVKEADREKRLEEAREEEGRVHA